MSQYKKDIGYLCALLLFPIWLLLFEVSNCELIDGPFAFVRGCNNYGIDWDLILARLGIVAPFLSLVSILYFLIRLGGFIKTKLLKH